MSTQSSRVLFLLALQGQCRLSGVNSGHGNPGSLQLLDLPHSDCKLCTVSRAPVRVVQPVVHKGAACLTAPGSTQLTLLC